MLKISLISLGLILGATTLAAAQSNDTQTPTGPANTSSMQQGRSVYVAPYTTEPQADQMRSYNRETLQEQQESNGANR
jgi:hypothetical protein